MCAQMAVFAMHWHQDLRLHQRMHCLKIRAVGMARYVIAASGIIHDVHADFRQLVDDLDHTTLVARNGF